MTKRRRQNAQGREIEWDFLSFPSVVMFALGMMAMGIGFMLGLSLLFWYAALIGVSFSLAHISTKFLRGRRELKLRERDTEEERERRAFAARARATQGEAEADGRPSRRRRRRR